VTYGAGDVRVEDVRDAALREPTDAIVRVTQSCICGGDLWPYLSMSSSGAGRRMGHEFIGVVEDVSSEVSGLRRGDVVVAPFVWEDNTCDFCAEGLHSQALESTITTREKRIRVFPTQKDLADSTDFPPGQ
jgi:threonine dehydrogenase-like Zn-dependent dehydrogenase